MARYKISILGSTGSIGQHTLDVIAANPDRFEVIALSANTSMAKLLEQCCVFKPQVVAMVDHSLARSLSYELKERNLSTVVLSGIEGVCEIAKWPGVQKVVAAIVGGAGLLPTLCAVEAGKQVLLANKEALVMSGDILMKTAKRTNAVILPMDSEHNALFQCMPSDYKTGIRPTHVSRLILTASGGPFLHFTDTQFESITPQMAVQHPNWNMGKKISVDSSTLMNKGLEVIEACRLFQFSVDEVDVLVHPQSVIHSLVEYMDGSFLAQLGSPDMKIPIAYCLGWPHRVPSGAKRLSLKDIGQLTFMEPDLKRFPCLELARVSLRLGKAASTVLNASNEVVVESFLNHKMRFLDIPSIIEEVMHRLYDLSVDTLDEILLADQLARQEAKKLVAKFSLRV